METNVEKPEVLKTSLEPSPLQIMENVEYLHYLRGMITNGKNVNAKLIAELPRQK
jgi:hypothetical protein